MAAQTERKIFLLCAACGVLSALAFLIPRFVPNQEGGFASAATAILAFLGMLLVAALVSLYLLFVTIQVYRNISIPARVAGIGPCVILVTALALLISSLGY
jgi:hypothetical protein